MDHRSSATNDVVEVWERKILRKMFGGNKVGETWERRTNKEFNEHVSKQIT